LIDVTNEPLFSGGRLCEMTFSDLRKEILPRIAAAEERG
jgi:hypothetical protein